MVKKVFKSERDFEWIRVLIRMPLGQRNRELKNCDLNSLAQAMIQFSEQDVKLISEGLNPQLKPEFIKAVKIYKGELPFPTKVKKKKKIVRQKVRIWLALLAVLILVITIYALNEMFPSD
ncbi:MAG: hypothetical protein R3219_04980 [Hydrogenovibrio sp.]|nr:hypothetical protein [Hydrogenovibrio sp.]